MPLYDYISTPTGATVALWHLTETEPELAALLPAAQQKFSFHCSSSFPKPEDGQI